MRRGLILSCFIFVLVISFVSAGWFSDLFKGDEITGYAVITEDCSNVVALYHFDGDASDSSGKGNDGVMMGGIDCSASGKLGNACSFDGVDDYVDLEGNPIFDLTEFTASIWVKPLLLLPESKTIFGHTLYKNWLLYHYGDYVYFRYKNIFGEFETFSFANALVSDQWTHLVLVYSNQDNSVTIYSNGDTSGINYGVENITNSAWGNTFLGIYNPPNINVFNGSMDEVIIYNRALTLDEVSELYNSGNGAVVSCGLPCVPDSDAVTCGIDVCGIKTNNCGGSVSCGICDTGFICTSGACVVQQSCTTGDTQSCSTGQPGICSAGTQTCSGESWGSCVRDNDPITEICGNSIDEDCDGSDLDCEEEIIYQCNDSIDNDEDGAIDFPADLGCSSLIDNDETDDEIPNCSHDADTDCSGCVGQEEIEDYFGLWFSGEPGVTIELVGSAIESWQSCGEIPVNGCDADSFGDECENQTFFYNIQNYTKGDVSNFEVYPKSTATEPDVGDCEYDSNFGTSVCKVSDVSNFSDDEIGDTVRPVYSRWAIDNSNGELYFLVKDGESPKDTGKGQMVIFNSDDDSIYKIATDINGHEAHEFRWDYSGARPYVMYYVSGCQFREYDVQTGQTSLVHDFSIDFPGCGRILNDVEGDSSIDSRYWAFMIQDPYDGAHYPMNAIITYDKQTDQILGTLDFSKYQSMGGLDTNLPRPNMVDISPLGTKVVVLFGRTDNEDIFDGPHAYDFDFLNPVKVCNDETHSGWAFNYDGNEVYVCQINNVNWPNADSDTIAYTDIITGETNTIIYHGDIGWDVGGVHFGKFYNLDIKGWVYMTTYSSYSTSESWLRNQAVMLELKPYDENPRVWRISSTHNNYPNTYRYSREAYSPISRDGKTIYWGSDWPNGDGTVDSYKVKLPDKWWNVLG